VQLNGVEV